MFAENVHKALRWLRSLDVRTVLIVLLVAVSTGHTGRLFADREDVRQAFVGYVLALAVDGVLAVSLYETANARKRSHRVSALCVFVASCAISGGFNVWYYRQNYPGDPLGVSILLGTTAPVLAAALSILKAMGDIQRTQARQAAQKTERALELEKYRIAQAEETRRAQIAEQERTKRERAKAQAEKAKADAIAQAKRTAGEQESARDNDQGNGQGNGRLKAGGLDSAARAILLGQPDIGPRPLARELGISPSTASGILKRIRGAETTE